PGSQRGPILARGALYYAAASGLLDAARTGENSSAQTSGGSSFALLPRVLRAQHEAGAGVAACDLAGIGHLVDVGAGPGLMARAALRAVPSMTATLVDRPATLERAQAEMPDAVLPDRCR